jgi:hypothetical protein
MVVINTNTNIAREHVNFTQAAIMIGVHRQTISKWYKLITFKKQYQWILYFKTIRLKRGILTSG